MNTSIQAKSNLWPEAWRAIANRPLWQFLFITIATLSSIIHPHVPLVAFAAVAGTSLTPKKALIAAMSIWLANQLYGYTIRQYPLGFESIVWGLAMGVGTLLVTWLATIRPKFSQQGAIGHSIWLGGTLVVGFGVYQGLILLAGQFMGLHGLTLEILGQIWLKDLFWTFSLGLAHIFSVNRAIKLTEANKDSHSHPVPEKNLNY